MASVNDGGPAFPFPSGPEPRQGSYHERWEGMSLRDYFAAKAISSIIGVNESFYGMQVACERAYKWADAMLAERNKPDAKA